LLGWVLSVLHDEQHCRSGWQSVWVQRHLGELFAKDCTKSQELPMVLAGKFISEVKNRLMSIGDISNDLKFI
jgi:hypothetical protein